MTTIDNISFNYKVKKTYLLVYFMIVASVISYIDIRKSVIPDRIIFPAIAVLLLFKWFETNLYREDFIALFIVLSVFMIPIVLDMAFGGGDLRFGAFCALFLGLGQVAWFIMIAGIAHLIVLALLRKKSFGFAPAMSLAALSAYLIGIL